MKLLPGVRLSVNKDSVGMSFGVPGARYTINSKGRRTVSTGIPGTGLYNVETLSGGRGKSRGSTTKAASASEEKVIPYNPPTSMQPGLFAKKEERALYAFLRDIFKWNETDTPDQAIEKATALEAEHPNLKWSLELLKFLYCVKGSSVDDSVAYQWGKELWSNRQSAFNDKYVRKY